jgi:mRNA interferase MazF
MRDYPQKGKSLMPDAGDVVWLEFPGAVVTKRRPAVVLSSKEYHAWRPDIIVGLVTSQTGKAGGSTDHLLADWSAAGLRVPSSFRSFLATISGTSVRSTMGRLSAADWAAVRACVKRSLEVA